MAPDEYWAQRRRLGTALRHLLWERRAVREMFNGTKDADLLQAGLSWMQSIYHEERRLCRALRELDLDFQESR